MSTDTIFIPFNEPGISVLVLSMLSNVFSIWIVAQIALGRIPMRPNVRYLMLANNLVGILWNAISVTRYYFATFPYIMVLHVLAGCYIVNGDYMSQFEILKLFHIITNLDPKKVLICQGVALSFSGFCVLGVFLNYGIPDNEIITLWDEYGLLVMTFIIVLFYIWYQLFLLRKMYVSMKVCKNEAKKQRIRRNYFRLMTEFIFLGVVHLFGMGVWGYGMISSGGRINIVTARLLIRAGECVAQWHLGLNVLFVQRIKQFKFPSQKSLKGPTLDIPTSPLNLGPGFPSPVQPPSVAHQPTLPEFEF